MDKRGNVQQKRGSSQNRGGSLIEIILVVAVMAFLVAILASQILTQVERTKVSADVQLANSVKRAVMIAMAEPVVAEAEKPGLPRKGMVLHLGSTEDFSGAFGNRVAELLEYESVAQMTQEEDGINTRLKSKGACGITVTIDHFGNCASAEIVDEYGRELIAIE